MLILFVKITSKGKKIQISTIILGTNIRNNIQIMANPNGKLITYLYRFS